VDVEADVVGLLQVVGQGLGQVLQVLFWHEARALEVEVVHEAGVALVVVVVAEGEGLVGGWCLGEVGVGGRCGV